jgi:hypothetical protein
MRKLVLAGTLAAVGCDGGPRESDFSPPHKSAAGSVRIELEMCRFITGRESRAYAEQVVRCMARRGYRYERRR